MYIMKLNNISKIGWKGHIDSLMQCKSKVNHNSANEKHVQLDQTNLCTHTNC